MVVAVVATLGLMAGEGVRYDGWVAMDPRSPLLLEGPDGPTVVKLAELEPRVAGSADDAYVHRDSAVAFEKLERAPLSRIGGCYALHVGSATVPEHEGGLTLRPELGYFVTERFGLKLAYEATFGSAFQQALLLHLQWMFAPYVGAWIHGGQVGIANREGAIGGGGVSLELPALTRMAFEARAGASFVGVGGWRDTVTSVTLGVAIY